MARPIKKGLDYFPLDTNFMNDRLVRRLKRRFGYKSVMLYITLLCDIYANSYYIDIIDDYIFDLSEQLEMDEQKITEILHYMAELGLFHAGLFNEKQIFTSRSIQERYLLAKQKTAVNQLIDKDHLLVIPEKTQVIPEKPLVIPEETPVIPSIIPQRKEKEKKEKENISECECVAHARTHTRENWTIWKRELLDDEDWRASAVRQSGNGVAFNSRLPQLLDDFCDFLIAAGEESTAQEKKDFTRRFHYWSKQRLREEKQAVYGKNNPKKPVSRLEEINRIGEESLVIARQLLMEDIRSRA